MTLTSAKSQSRIFGAVAMVALAGVVLFQFFGNASRGYVNTSSTFWWWISQWIDPRAETEHGWLILGISAWLLWRNLRASKPFRTVETASSTDDAAVPTDAPSSSGGWIVLGASVAALALHAIGYIAQQTRISIVALLIFTWAVVRLADRRWAAAAAFPIGFLVFAIPLNVLDSIGFWLRMGVIDATTWIAPLIGVDVVRSGTQLFAPDGRYQYDVAAACSGVRSLMALSALSLLIGYVNFKTLSRRSLMLLLCFPLTYVGNVVRVVVIVLSADLGGPRWGALMHDLMGYGLFAIVLGGVFGAVALVQRFWPEKPQSRIGRVAQPPAGRASPPDEPSEANKDGSRESYSAAHRERLALPVAMVVVALAVVEMVGLARIASGRGGQAGVRLDADAVNPVDLPAFIGTDWVGRRTEVTELERQILPADTGFSRRTYVSVKDRSHAVFVSIVLSGRDRTSIHRPEICLVGQGWTIEERRLAGAEGPMPERTILRTSLIEPRTQRELKTVVAYWFVSADGVVATHWQRFLHDAWNRLRHGRVDRWAYVLVQSDAQDSEAGAVARMQAVLAEVLPLISRR